uniref:LIM zinc-binding domain-containing protein n=1 Tax=Poecilia reticulata TaxID=8081 RepID=A0A3P9PZJ9_POERE
DDSREHAEEHQYVHRRSSDKIRDDVCFFCKQKVYVMERLSAEGLFFHRSCFRCDSCSAPLRLVSYSYDQDFSVETSPVIQRIYKVKGHA